MPWSQATKLLAQKILLFGRWTRRFEQLRLRNILRRKANKQLSPCKMAFYDFDGQTGEAKYNDSGKFHKMPFACWKEIDHPERNLTQLQYIFSGKKSGKNFTVLKCTLQRRFCSISYPNKSVRVHRDILFKPGSSDPWNLLTTIHCSATNVAKFCSDLRASCYEVASIFLFGFN